MRILVIEDEPKTAAYLKKGLEESGYSVEVANDGSHGLILAQEEDYDVIILDVMLPWMDGWTVVKTLRATRTTPVLFLTARDDVNDRVRGLELGADDYLVKPFALTEFEARVRALLRRRTSHGAPEFRIGRLRLDIPGHRAWVGDSPLDLTAREFGLIEALATRADKVTSRAQLVEALCNWDEDLTDNGLDIALHRLRKKLQGSGTNVRTIRGLGYLLEESVDA
jgi:two-component system, OmpR family, response regulator